MNIREGEEVIRLIYEERIEIITGRPHIENRAYTISLFKVKRNLYNIK